MSRTIALTGATGFIGSAVLESFAAEGWQMRALIRSKAVPARFAKIDVQWIQGSLDELTSLRHLVEGVDHVIHCAGVVRGVSQSDFDRVNVDGVGRLAEAASAQQPVPQFLLISSLAAREPHLSAYAASKRKGEDTLTLVSAKLHWVALRPPAVYGPGDREILPLFRWMIRGIAPIIGFRNARFSLIHVEDLAEAIKDLLVHPTQSRSIFELHDGHPNGYGWQDVIDTVEQVNHKRVLRIPVPSILLRCLAGFNAAAAWAAGYAPMLTPGKIRELMHPDWTCDNEALSRATGWQPRIGLEEGLRRTLAAAL
jgi:nucleoside-diphosphate-sugar epimerase